MSCGQSEGVMRASEGVFMNLGSWYEFGKSGEGESRWQVQPAYTIPEGKGGVERSGRW